MHEISGKFEKSVSQTFIPVRRKWDVISHFYITEEVSLKPPDGLEGLRAYYIFCTGCKEWKIAEKTILKIITCIFKSCFTGRISPKATEN